MIFLILPISPITNATTYYLKKLSIQNQSSSPLIEQVSVRNDELTVNIKQQKIDNCITGTIKYRIADRATAKQLCTCTIGIRSKMTVGQLWEIESYAQSGIDPNKLPYVIKIQQALQQCTIGLTLNPPQRL